MPHTFKARPTTDFAKENLFNVLSNYIDFEEEGLKALDLFSGTGSIGIELVSRGCERVVSVEKDAQHCAFIRKVIQEVGARNWELVRGDALKYIDKCGEAFNFVFADPPYALPQLREIPDRVLAGKLLKPGGMLVLEHGKDYSFADHPACWMHRAYGSVNFSFFKAAEQADEPPTL